MDDPIRRKNGKVPFGIKAAYGTGALADGIKNSVFNSFLLFYYTGVLGLPGSLAGTALFLAMCFDAVSDPIVGYLSDHTRSRWGRRHPYMYAAAVPMGVSVYLLLAPPAGLEQTGLFVWMTAFSISVRLALTLHMIPRSALVPEITHNYDERTGMVAAGFLMGWVGGLGLVQIAWLVIIPSVANGRMDPEAYRQIGAVGGVASALAIFISAAGMHRVIPTLRTPEKVTLGFRPFIHEVQNAFKNKSFRMIMIGGIIISAAANFQEVFGLYMNTYFWEFEDGDIARLALASCSSGGGGGIGSEEQTIQPCNEGRPSFDIWRADFAPQGRQFITATLDTLDRATAAEFRLVLACQGEVVGEAIAGIACSEQAPSNG